jgi:hypothetical protein
MRRLVPVLMASAVVAYVGCTQTTRIAQGDQSGQCYPNKTCNSGLQCNSASICVPSSSSGGSGAGGTNDTGGTTSTGGNKDTGGTTSTTSSGGTSDTGGTTNTGGTSDTGGTSSSGGTSDTGGTTNTGGTSSNGGSSGTVPAGCTASSSTTEATFCNGLAMGAMTGYGWVALGSADTLTEPTCDAAKAAITSAAPCLANTNWSKPDALCMSGSIPALPGDAGATDYSSNWGVQVGVNAKDPSAALGSNWKTITFDVTGSPSSGLRAVLHKAGDPDSTGYCYAMTPGTALKITDFNSKCWDSSGTALTEADAGSIDKMGVQVTSTATAITVSSLCLTKITFGN